MVFDHYLTISYWSLELVSPGTQVRHTHVWIRFSGLNLVFYNESFLLTMAYAIDKPIRVDMNTLRVERGKFTRV